MRQIKSISQIRTKKDTVHYGTCFPVARDVFLTCRHLGDAEEKDTQASHLEVGDSVWICPQNKVGICSKESSQEGSVVWEDEALDLALVKLAHDEGGQEADVLELCLPSPLNLDQPKRVEGGGFPHFGSCRGEWRYKSFTGMLRKQSDGTFEFTSEIADEDKVKVEVKADWSCVSGSPLLWSSRLVGVIRSIPQGPNGEFYVTPMDALLKNKTACEFLPFADRWGKIPKLQEILTGMASKAPALLGELCKRLEICGAESQGAILRPDPAEMATKISGKSLHAFLEDVLAVSNKTLDGLAELTFRMSPLLLDDDVTFIAREQLAVGAFCQWPLGPAGQDAETFTTCSHFAHLVLAAGEAGARTFGFEKKLNSDEPTPLGCLNEMPEDFGSERTWADHVIQNAEKLIVEGVLGPRTPLSAGAISKAAAKAKAKALSEFRYYYAFTIPAGRENAWQLTIEKLREKYPFITFIHLLEGPSGNTDEVMEFLRQIFHKTNPSTP